MLRSQHGTFLEALCNAGVKVGDFNQLAGGSLEMVIAQDQCSCLENPRDGGAWWAAVYGVTQSWTRLKRLSSSSSILVYKMNL